MQFSDELKREVFDFVSAIYRVTECMPQNEAARCQLREQSLRVLTKVAGGQTVLPECAQRAHVCELLASIESAKGIIALTHRAGLMKAINAEVLNRECDTLEAYFQYSLKNISHQEAGSRTRKELAEPIIQNDTPYSIKDTERSINDITKRKESSGKNGEDAQNKAENEPQGNVNGRQGTILGYIKANKEAKVSDLAAVFSNRFSLKTLQRDLACLIANGAVERHGDKRWAVYRLNGETEKIRN